MIGTFDFTLMFIIILLPAAFAVCSEVARIVIARRSLRAAALPLRISRLEREIEDEFPGSLPWVERESDKYRYMAGAIGPRLCQSCGRTHSSGVDGRGNLEPCPELVEVPRVVDQVTGELWSIPTGPDPDLVSYAYGGRAS